MTHHPHKPPADALRRVHLLEALDDTQLAFLHRTMRVRSLDEGERLFDFGQPPLNFFYLERGLVKLFRNAADGSEKVIELVRGGETFAEAVMFMQHARGYPVSAEAVSESEVYVFDCQTMTDLLRESVDSCFRMMASMSRRLRQHVDEIDRLTLHNATFRLANFLLQQVPEGSAAGAGVDLSMPKNVLASRLAVQPETFSRILARLARSGVLEVKRHEIVVKDVPALRALVEP